MNQAHLHLILVHVPVVLMPTATLLLVFAHLRKQTSILPTICALFVTAALFAGVAFSLGEGAEEVAEHLPGISEHLIEEHEEAGDVALVLSLITGILGLATGIVCAKFQALQRAALTALFISGAAASLSLGHTAYEGGKIRHPEAYDTGSVEPTETHTDDQD